MTGSALRVALEIGSRRTFAIAVDWPGWARSGRDEDKAVAALLTYTERYATVLAASDLDVDVPRGEGTQIVERLAGTSGTDFGVPAVIAEADRSPVRSDEADLLARFVEAAWAKFDDVAARAPEALRKGPRGGGRDRSKIVEHVTEADAAYARELGVRLRPAVPRDVEGVASMRESMLEVLRAPSDGSPLAGRTWPQRYATRRIAWHAVDHAWEIEDRSEQNGGGA